MCLKHSRKREKSDMGKTLDALLGKGFKTCKFKSLVELLSSRIAALEKQHRLRCMQSQCDAIELLKLGHQESALLRVELVIAEQNLLDAYAMIENFCNLLVERVVLVEHNRECPIELKEAISSLIFAASKLGELQELEKISGMFAKRFGKEFASNAVDLCNNCGVCPKIVSKLSTLRPSLEIKLSTLKEIALGNQIDLHLEGDQDRPPMETIMDSNEKKMVLNQSSEKDRYEPRHEIDHPSIEQKKCESFPEEVLGRRKYKDFKAAAQDAYKLAAHAAVAARAAVELSQPLDKDHYHPRKSVDEKRSSLFDQKPSKSEHSDEGEETSGRKKVKENESEIHAKAVSSFSPLRGKMAEMDHGDHLKRD